MNLAQIISRHAAASPRAPAVIEGERVYSYEEFDAAIRCAADGLRRLGVVPGEIVGVSMRDTALHLAVAYALARLGAVQLSLPLRESAQARAGLASRFGATSMVVDTPDAPLPGMRIRNADPAWLEPSAAPSADAAPGGDAPWKIVMSSGTTSSPKAVLRSHAFHITWREIYARAIPGRPDDRFLQIIPLDFYAGVRQCMEMHWSGACAVVGAQVRSLNDLVQAVERYGINSLHLLPTHLQPMLPLLPADRPLFPGLRVLRTGAMIVSRKLREQIRRRLTPHLYITYGTNDIGSALICAGPALQDSHPGCVGVPVPGVEVEIVDEQGRALAADETGLIRVRMADMPRGYIGNPEATARAFRGGWYYPGDLGQRSADGVFWFKGRADDLMNYDGIKIYPSDIESALAEHPAVAEAAAFPIPSRAHQDIPAAAVVLKTAATVEALHEWCVQRLGTRAPKIIVILSSLPRNPNGKVLTRELARSLRSGSAAPAGAR